MSDAAGAPPKRTDSFTVFLGIACAALAVLVVLLARQNLKLKHELGEATRNPFMEDAIKPGEALEPLTLVDAEGTSRELRFGAGENRTLLLVFSIQCPACEQTLPMWQDMVPSWQADPSLRVVAVQTDMVTDPETDPGALPVPPLTLEVWGVDFESPAIAQIPSVPAAILLDPQGVASNVWFGVPSAEALQEFRETVLRAGS